MQATWPAVANMAIVDMPNMHPRASTVSGAMMDRRAAADGLVHDQPPDYENALINSKPISWIVASHEEQPKLRASSEDHQSSDQQDSKRRRQQLEQPIDIPRPTTRGDTIGSGNVLGSNANEPHKISSPTDNMTQLALSIVRGFTSTQHQHPVGFEDSATRSDHQERPRKTSYCQLDVNQLTLKDQESPPKYCEITMPRIDQALSNQSNEPRAGSPPASHE